MLPLAPPPPLSPLRLILLLLLCRRPLLSLLSLPAQRQFEFVSAHFLVLSPPFRVLSFVRLSCKITCVYVTHCVSAVLQCAAVQLIQPNVVAYNQIWLHTTKSVLAAQRHHRHDLASRSALN